MDFRRPIETRRGIIKTTREALNFINRELPAELKALSRWSFAEALLLEAEQSQKSRDMDCAYRQLRQALKNDRLIKRGKPKANPEAISGQVARSP